jgi:SAM-dependent methyltransferase
VTADYGLDAPGLVRSFAQMGGAAAAAAVLFAFLGSIAAVVLAALVAIPFVATAAAMVHSSRRGKLTERDRLLDGLALRGDEAVLDVGCGRGLLLIGAARRLEGGRAVGIDIWSSRDQSGNSREATLHNAEAEGVTDRVEVVDGDMLELPFPDASFDCVVSSLAVHNEPDAEDRHTACTEMVRVLRPGGRVAVLDVSATQEYAQAFEGAGLEAVQRSGRRWRMYPPTRLVTARKPG